mmetsp:Transcript_31347/g.78627  ORF Transcript_31347/g.78627 Transcript_31347/m.78627 type:complete len:210 (-) Transcript_31347:1409-2038(-)
MNIVAPTTAAAWLWRGAGDVKDPGATYDHVPPVADSFTAAMSSAQTSLNAVDARSPPNSHRRPSCATPVCPARGDGELVPCAGSTKVQRRPPSWLTAVSDNIGSASTPVTAASSALTETSSHDAAAPGATPGDPPSPAAITTPGNTPLCVPDAITTSSTNTRYPDTLLERTSSWCHPAPRATADVPPTPEEVPEASEEEPPHDHGAVAQ